MTYKGIGKIWDENADDWLKLTRQGHDKYRDYVNMPAFLSILPDISGLRGLDIGCGEGHTTRMLARRGANMTGIDVSEKLINFAREEEQVTPLGIEYTIANALELPYGEATFDFVTGFMSFMDIPEHEKLVGEVYRVLKPSGFLQIAIMHPCFVTPRFKWVRDKSGRRIALECGDYFKQEQGKIEKWTFRSTPLKFHVARFYRTLSGWLNLLIERGFILDRIEEPFANDKTIETCSNVADSRIIAYFLHIQCHKN